MYDRQSVWGLLPTVFRIIDDKKEEMGIVLTGFREGSNDLKLKIKFPSRYLHIINRCSKLTTEI